MEPKLVCCASILKDEGMTEIKRMPFVGKVQEEVIVQLTKQIKTFEKYDVVKFNGEYKAEDNEKLQIVKYEDPDKTISNFIKIKDGIEINNLDNLDVMVDCKALLFLVPEFPNYICIQRFTRSLIADRSKFWSFYDSGTLGHLNTTSISLASSLSGIYNLDTQNLDFRSIATIRSSLPKLVSTYAPGASKDMMSAFFSNKNFDSESTKEIISSGSQKIKRLVWLITNEKGNIKDFDIPNKISELKIIDKLLNIGCISGNRIVFSNKVKKNEIILSAILGDVIRDKDMVYLSNSKKALDKFD